MSLGLKLKEKFIHLTSRELKFIPFLVTHIQEERNIHFSLISLYVEMWVHGIIVKINVILQYVPFKMGSYWNFVLINHCYSFFGKLLSRLTVMLTFNSDIYVQRLNYKKCKITL